MRTTYEDSQPEPDTEQEGGHRISGGRAGEEEAKQEGTSAEAEALKQDMEAER